MVRTLPPSPLGERLLARHDRTDTDVIIHVRSKALGRKHGRDELEHVQAAAGLAASHILPILGWGFWPGRGDRLAWVTPYTGSAAGLVTLRDHVRAKGGRLEISEANRVVQHLWAGTKAAHAAGHVQGVVEASAVLIDTHGQTWYENYGLYRRLHPDGVDPGMLRRLEAFAIARLGLELTTGLSVPMPSNLPELPSWPEIPESWRAKARSMTEDAFASAITAALEADDAVPAIARALRDGIETVLDARDRVASEVAETVKAKAGAVAKSAIQVAFTAILDKLRGR